MEQRVATEFMQDRTIDAKPLGRYFPAMSAALKLLPPPAPVITWEQYLQRLAASKEKLEYVNGQVYAMAGASEDHNRIAGNVFGELWQALKGKPCEPFVADMLLRIESGLDKLGYFPDVMVICDKTDRNPQHRTAPKLLVEVLSKSTRRIDTREKLTAYQGLPSLEVYITLEQTSMKATIYRRSNQWWPEIVEGEAAVITLDELGIKLALRDVYARVEWSAVESESEA